MNDDDTTTTASPDADNGDDAGMPETPVTTDAPAEEGAPEQPAAGM